MKVIAAMTLRYITMNLLPLLPKVMQKHEVSQKQTYFFFFLKSKEKLRYLKIGRTLKIQWEF